MTPARSKALVALLGLMRGALASRGVPKMAKLGKETFDMMAATAPNTTVGMSAEAFINAQEFPTMGSYWCAWELTDRKRKVALVLDDVQMEYTGYLRAIMPQIKLLVDTFREAGHPIFWSAWWRWGPDDGYFNAMDRFYGPVGWNSSLNALYLHTKNGGDIIPEVGPVTEEEKKRVMRKSYSLSVFDENPLTWLVPANQSNLHDQLQELGVDTIVLVGAWTDDCIINAAFDGFRLQYDVVVVEDGVSTASRSHYAALDVMRGSMAKVLMAKDVADYINTGLPVREQLLGARTGAATLRATEKPAAAPQAAARPEAVALAAPSSASGVSGGGLGPLQASLLSSVMLAAGFAAGWALRGTGTLRPCQEPLIA